MCRDMEELCPDVTFLQYVNPMAMNCWAISRATSIKTVGLCHSVPGTAEELARDIGAPIDEISYQVAGINHMAFYLKFERNGEDLYPLTPAGARRRARSRAQPRALRDAEAAGLLRHRVERALRRVRAVVHQARPARPDRALQHPAGRVPAPLRRADRRLGSRARAARARRVDRGAAQQRVRAPRSSTAWRPASRA